MDLHMHTPASRDYEQPEIHYLDILRQAERRGLDLIAFTDHNTVNGYRNMQREIADLEMLERLGRIRADEMGRLSEYRRLLKKILVLPGFELTATFGFHVIGLFPPEKPLRDIEYILLQLRVPPRVLDQGLTEAGATSDVLTAYRLIDEAGGIVIAPHANSSNGVFMRGMNIGGQTRMAYTQDEHLHAIELTDLAKGRRSMAMWFSGSKPEYSRRMHVIQGSDAHRLTASPTDAKRLGVGDRATEVQLPEVSFNALRELFLTRDFSRERPANSALDVPSDVLRSAREKGNTTTQSFHSALPKRGDRYVAILNDVSAFANSEGGAVYIGCDAHLLKPAAGISDAAEVSTELAEAIQQRITPTLNVTIDLQNSDEVNVLRVNVPRGPNAPYAVDGYHFQVRTDSETHLASRDEIVTLVRGILESERSSTPAPATRSDQESRPAQPSQQRQPQQQPQRQQQQRQQPQRQQQQQRPAQTQQGGQQNQQGQQGARDQQRRDQQRREQQRQQQPTPTNGNKQAQPPLQAPAMLPAPAIEPAANEAAKPAQVASSTPATPPPPVEPQVEGTPRSGVEIIAFEERDGMRYYTVRDLRNKSVVRNVTQKSARDLWLYAIMQQMNDVYDAEQFQWQNERAILSRSQRAGKVRYDLALRDANGKVHIFYGVSDDGLDSNWKELIQAVMPPIEESPQQPAMLMSEAEAAPAETIPGIAELQETIPFAPANTFMSPDAAPVGEPVAEDNSAPETAPQFTMDTQPPVEG
jgi:hypothetical protein